MRPLSALSRQTSAFCSLPSALRVLALGLGLAGVAAALPGCDVQVGKGDFEVNAYAAELKEEWLRSYQLSSDGQIEIANLNGPIELSKASGSAVDVRAEIVVRALTETMARDVLAKGRIEESTTPNRVKVETVVPRGIHGKYQVRYQVSLPPGVAVQVSTTNGALKAMGLDNKLKASIVNGSIEFAEMAGPIDAALVNGSLSATLARVTAPVRLETTNGRLSLALPKDSKATLSVRVVNGGLSVNGLPLQEPPQRRIRNLDATLNGGGPPIDLHATNGRITITGTP